MSGAQIIVTQSVESYADEAAAWIAAAIAKTISENGNCSLALAGGSTPKPVYECLARPPHRDEIAWPKLEIMFGDERCVSPEDAESNYRMARKALLDHVPLDAQKVHRMEAEREDREAAARAYEAVLPDALDLLILGLGGDGHTASLFPSSPLLEERDRLVAVTESPKAPPWRLTITPPVIEQARLVVVLAQGSGKAAMVSRVLEGPQSPTELPVQLARDAVWMLDPFAAASIRESNR